MQTHQKYLLIYILSPSLPPSLPPLKIVNGRICSKEKVRVLEDIIFGPIDSHCTIVFRSLRSGTSYHVTFKRHMYVLMVLYH